MKRCLFALVLLAGFPERTRAGLPEAPPEDLGFDPARLAAIDSVVAKALDEKAVPGAVVLVGRRGKIAYVKASGRRQTVPVDEPMTRDTIFDLASLTKPVATATSAMILVERGELRLDDRLGKLLPRFDNHGKGEITVEQLLRHRSGLIADNPLADFADGPETAWSRLASLDLVHPPGTSYVYSDVGFMTLGKIVESVSGKSLDTFARDEVFRPLGMSDTGFTPADPSRVAPTEPSEGKMLRGTVHDPRARALGGVAGHAGLFGTADDLAVYAQTLLNGGIGPDGRRI
ncbi:MAG: beta-lactamase family protein, partial [Planctomycetia bacterium]|nr:beta-lactamase family protein [Planctomycetia bacterium]